jgi:LacI family transcriptional regulator, galactose operon repressor
MAGPHGPAMKDVAARAGVALGTVSNVLNRPHLVSDHTRRKVLSAIEELGFVPNESARQLAGAASRTVAFVVFDMSNPFFTDVAQGAQAAADAAGLSLYLCNSGEDTARQNAYLDLLEQQRVEGVLITPVDARDPRLRSLHDRGTPVVVVARGRDLGYSAVAVDDFLGGELAVTHLLDTGHRRIAFVGRAKDFQHVADRLAGAEQAIAGSDAEPLIVLETDRTDIAEGRRAGERLAGIPVARRPTAVFCANDLLALGLVQQVVRLGLRVPEDVAVVGYDDIEFAQAASVPLTTVSQPRELLGRAAVELLLEQRRGPNSRHRREVVFQPELVVRESTRLHTRPS